MVPGAKRLSAQGSALSAFTVAEIAWLVSMSHILRPSTMAIRQPLRPPGPTMSIMLVDTQDISIKRLTFDLQVELLQRISTIESRLAELSGQPNRNE